MFISNADKNDKKNNIISCKSLESVGKSKKVKGKNLANSINQTMLSRVSLVLATSATVHAAKNGRALNAAENARSAAYQTCYDNEFAAGGVS